MKLIWTDLVNNEDNNDKDDVDDYDDDYSFHWQAVSRDFRHMLGLEPNNLNR